VIVGPAGGGGGFVTAEVFPIAARLIFSYDNSIRVEKLTAHES